jgi:predicted RNase H-like HicB family nuclease
VADQVDHYRINIFWSEEDDCWAADIPELEYCSAFRDTPKEALSEITVAKQLWLEVALERGLPLPEPAL